MKYYISDLHLGHENIMRLCKRPFRSVEEMDETLIKNWNSVVKPTDEVYILGDFNFKSAGSGANYLRKLNGKKFLITGNHDNVTPEMRSLCEWVGSYKEVHDGDTKIVLFHYPIVEWNGYFRGSLHFYGHIHNSFENDAHKIMKNIKNAYNVGADILDFTPQTMQGVIDCNRRLK
jgi:calcineurin-like phosphoesterase family protein